MCQVHTDAYVSLLAPGKTDYTACHPRKTTTYILHVVSITTHTHGRRKSIGKKETQKRKEDKGKERKEKRAKKKRKRKGKKREDKKSKKRQEKQEKARQEEEARKGKEKKNVILGDPRN